MYAVRYYDPMTEDVRMFDTLEEATEFFEMMNGDGPEFGAFEPKELEIRGD